MNRQLRWFNRGMAVAAMSLLINGSLQALEDTKTGRVRSEPGSVATQMIVTVQQPASLAGRSIGQQDVLLRENGKRAVVTHWRRLSESSHGVQLVIVMDDSSRSTVSLQLTEMRDFITALPPSVAVGIGYMRNGSVYMAQDLTLDHERAAKALRLPQGTVGGNGSPYFTLSDFSKHWPSQEPGVREVLMVTDGVDRYYNNGQFDPNNPYVDAAIRDAQKAAVMVSFIYFSGAGGLDRDNRISLSGQSYQVRVAEATGGKAYYLGDSNPVSFLPFFTEIRQRMSDQYLLTYLSRGDGLQRVKVSTELPHTKLFSPESVIAGHVIE